MPSARPLRTAKAPGKLALLAVRWASIRCAARDRREIERAGKRAVGERQPSEETARVGAEPAARMRPTRVERGDRDHRRRIVRKQDLAVAGERPQLRSAARAIIEPRRGRVEQQAHRPDAERVIGPLEEQVEPAAARYARRAPAAAARISPAGRSRRCGKCRPSSARPRPTASASANRAADW